ncbi:MAG: T9SS type A sorting domain-containing protein [Chitinophagaceae bacterium]|jgi:hypothetical protein
MLKIVATIFILFFGISSQAQCPYISGALMDAADVGLPAGEGKNEFIAFTTGSSSLAVNTFSVGYGTTTAANDMTIDGSTITWQTLAVSPAITNSAGTITNITSDSIPANTPVVILNSNNTISYDLATFGPNVYVLVYSSAGAGVSGYFASGRFANKSAPSGLRYFRVTAGACNNVVSYDKNAAGYSSIDGAGAKWNSSGSITYINTGSSGIVLPVNLISAKAYKEQEKTILEWKTSGNSSAVYFEIEKSKDGGWYRNLGIVNANPEHTIAEKAYSFIDQEESQGINLYRIHLIDFDGSQSYSPVLQLRERSQDGRTKIYPNPVLNELNIQNTNGELVSFCIYDLMGRLALHQNLTSGENVIDVAALASGTYMLKLNGNAKPESFKIIIH